ncbi:unnamed protein product, partial [Rotaria sp. Silwood1]
MVSTFLEKSGLDLSYFDEQFEPQHTKNIEPEFSNEALDSDVVVCQGMSLFHLVVLDYWREIQIGDQVKLRWFRSCLR